MKELNFKVSFSIVFFLMMILVGIAIFCVQSPKVGLYQAYNQSNFLIEVTQEVVLDPDKYFEEGESVATIKDIMQIRPDLMINENIIKSGAFYYLNESGGYQTLFLLFNKNFVVGENNEIKKFKLQDDLIMKLKERSSEKIAAINGVLGKVDKGVFTSLDKMRKKEFNDEVMDVENRATLAIIL